MVSVLYVSIGRPLELGKSEAGALRLDMRALFVSRWSWSGKYNISSPDYHFGC